MPLLVHKRDGVIGIVDIRNQEMHRRRFISTATAIGGSWVWSQQVRSQATGANDFLNVGIVGTGAQGQILLKNCAETEGVRVTALCDIWENYNLNRASTMLQGFGHEHKTYKDYKEMLAAEKELHAVIVATPDFCHAEQTIACLQAGIPVYCESMMSNTLEGAKSMVRAAKETGKLLQIGYQRRSNPYYRYCYDHVINETKLLGKITAANAQWNRPVQTDRGWPRRSPIDEAVLKANGYASMDQFRNWQWYKELGGGPLAELGVHQIDVLNWYFGATPQTLLASGGTLFYSPDTHQWPDTFMGICEYPADKGAIRASYQTHSSNSNFGFFESFLGSEGTLYVSESIGRVKVYREPASPDWDKWVRIGILGAPEKKEEPKEKKDALLDVQETVLPPTYDIPVKSTEPIFKPHLQNFFNAIRGKESLNCPPEIALQSTVIAIKLNQAALETSRMDIKPEDFQI